MGMYRFSDKIFSKEDTGSTSAVGKFHAYNTSDISIPDNGVYTQLNINQNVVADSIYSNNSGVVQIQESGVYFVVVYISTYGGGRTTSRAKLEKDSGSGFSFINGTQMSFYNRTTADGETNASVSIFHSFQSGDSIRIMATEDGTSNNVVAVKDSCGLTIMKFG